MNSQSMTAAEARVLRADAARVRAQQDHRTEPVREVDASDVKPAAAA